MTYSQATVGSLIRQVIPKIKNWFACLHTLIVIALVANFGKAAYYGNFMNEVRQFNSLLLLLWAIPAFLIFLCAAFYVLYGMIYFSIPLGIENAIERFCKDVFNIGKWIVISIAAIITAIVVYCFFRDWVSGLSSHTIIIILLATIAYQLCFRK
jgi:hypothetical protein